MPIDAKYLVNSFHITVRAPPEILGMVSTYLTEGDVFSASQVCHHWRSVLTSFPSLWTRFPCCHVPRTIASLERCKSMPIQVDFDSQSSIAAVEKIVLRKNTIASLTVYNDPDRTPLLYQLFMLSRPSVKLLHISEGNWWQRAQDSPLYEIWQDLPSLRELSVCRYSMPVDRLAAPNLIHLALQQTACRPDISVKSILDMLRGCPLLETVLIINSSVLQGSARDHSPVSLPHLRSIELSSAEVYSGLMTYLQLPPNVAVGFRVLFPDDVHGHAPPTVIATIQHTLGGIDIRCMTLAVDSRQGYLNFLVRFEGPGGSLEIIVNNCVDIRKVLFGPTGALFSHSPRLENVRELHIAACPFDDEQGLHHISAAMPNLVSITFFDCEGPHIFGLLTPTDPSSPPFPHLERIMVLGQASGLREMSKVRKECGVPVKTLVVGRGPWKFEDEDSEDYSGLEGFMNDHLEDFSGLGDFVDDLHIEGPTASLGWKIGNEILKVWTTIWIPAPVSPNGDLAVPG